MKHIAVLFIVIFLLSQQSANSFSTFNTHPALSKEIAEFFNTASQDNKLSQDDIKWLTEGSIREDQPPRYINHFYDPIHKIGWTGKHFGYLSEEEGLKKGAGGAPRPPLASIDWVANQDYQSAYGRQYGNQTWQKAIKSYLDGDKKAAFLSLGHVIHLIEDLGVPDHTRDDTHAGIYGDPGSPFEEYAKEYTNYNTLKVAKNLKKNNQEVGKFNNIHDAFVALANYSNNNFFSEDTINNNDFESPNSDKTEKRTELVNGRERKFLYDKVNNIYLAVQRGDVLSTDEKDFVLPSYRDHLFPQVVLTGAGVLDLFFREAEKAKENPQVLEPIIPDASQPWRQALKAAPKVAALNTWDFMDAVGTKTQVLAVQSARAAQGLAVALAAKSTAAVKGFVQKVAGRSQEVALTNVGEVLGETATPSNPHPTLSLEGRGDLVYSARLVSQSSANITLKPNTAQTMSVSYQNTGTATWKTVFGEGNVSLNLAGADSSPLYDSSWLTPKRPVGVSRDVNSNETIEFGFTVRAPAAPGVYQLALRPVVYQGGSFLLGGEAVGWNIIVAREGVKEPEPVEISPLSSQTPPPTPPQGEGEPLIPSLPPPPPPPPPAPSAPVFIIIHAPDKTPPTSSINALPATQATSTFAVSWQGSDNLRPTPKSYDLQYQVNNGAWVDWLTETTATSTPFTGQDEKTYGFRSRARDDEGNVSEYPASAERATYVNLSAPNAPTVTSHTNNQIIYTSSVTLSGAADAQDNVVITLNQTTTTATTTASGLGAWSQLFTLAAGTNTFTLKSVEADGDISTTTAFTLRTIGSDQTQLVSDTDQLWGWYNAGSYHDIAQSFVPTYSTISNVSLEICRIGTVTNQAFTVKVYTGDTFGTGTLAAGWLYNVATQAQSDVINALIPLCDNFQFVNFGLGTQFTSGNTEPMPITPGNVYHFVFDGGNGNIYRTKYRSSGNIYASGEMGRQELMTWSNVAGADLVFKTLGVP